MNPLQNSLLRTRRQFFGRSAVGIGTAALASLLEPRAQAQAPPSADGPRPGTLRVLHHAPTAKRVIYLFMSGGPSHIDLFDHKPALRRHHGTELPASVRRGQRVTGMTSGQASFPCIYPMFRFAQHGQSGAWMSELLPHMATVADEFAFVKSMHTEAINHDPAITLFQTGSQQPGRPSCGAWASYGLGCETSNLPAFVVLVSQGSGNRTDQPLFSRLWGSGFLPSEHQGVRLRAGADPVLYLSNPPGVDRDARRDMIDATRRLNEIARENYLDPEIDARIVQYEMAYRMQASVPELVDLRSETRTTLDEYGVDRGHDDGGFARNCLLARRMIERGVRFVQLMHRGWDQHGGLPGQIRGQCQDVDRPSAALVRDLKRRGLLDDTLVVWGGEFGRTVYSQGALTATNYGRDHHGRCFTVLLAGGGIKPGVTHGETDDYCYNVVRDPVHVHDFNATVLHTLGVDHTRMTFRYQGRDYRLTDVHGEVVREILK